MIDAILDFFGLRERFEGPCRVDPAGFSTREILEALEYSGSWMAARDANKQILKNIMELEERVGALEEVDDGPD